MYIVYKHTSPTGKSYIGLTSQGMKHRAGPEGKRYAECTAFYRAIQKYGWDGFTHEVLEQDLTFEEACEKEQYYIRKYRSLTTENGYNLENGGRVSCKVSEETKAKISKTLTGRKRPPLSLETRRKMSEARKGKKMTPRGEEYSRRLSAALTGRTFTPEHCRHISEGKKGTQVGANNPRARQVLCVETGVVFDTIKDAGAFTGGSPKNIISCCRGRLKTSGGYHWQYVTGGVSHD